MPANTPFSGAPAQGDGHGVGAAKKAASYEVEAEEDVMFDDVTDEEKLEIARRCLRCVDVLLLLIGAGLAGACLYASTLVYGSISAALMYAGGGIGGTLFAIMLLGLFAVCTRNTRTNILLIYFTFLIFIAFAVLVLGGFCFILQSTAVSYVEDNWDSIVTSLPADKRDITLDEAVKIVKIALYTVGGVAGLIFLLCLSAMSNAVALITPSRAYTVFLQATNIALLPIGVALIAAAVYVADTAIATEAAAASFAIFILGTFVVVLLLLGCVGTSLQSRGIVRLFMVLTLLLSMAFLAFGVLSLVQSTTVSKFIASQWATIRRVLPPDFSGRYDKEVFERYIDANLTALGFLSLCAGVVLFAQTFASFRLRSELKFESELEQEAWDAVKNKLIPADVAQSIAPTHNKGKMKLLWKQHWTKGTKTSRRVILCGCCTLCSAVIIAVTLASLALYYSTSCTKLTEYEETRAYDTVTFGSAVYMDNLYALGTIAVSVSTTLTTPKVTAKYRKAAFKSDMANAEWPTQSNRTYFVASSEGVDPVGSGVGSTVVYSGITVAPKEKKELLGYDISCQNSDVTATVPRTSVWTSGQSNSVSDGDAHPLAFNLTAPVGSAGVMADWSATQYVDRPRVRYFKARTVAGPIDLDSVLLGSMGADLSSSSGDITLQSLEARCDPSYLGGGQVGVLASSVQGAIMVSGLDSRDCDVLLGVDQAMLQVQRSSVVNTLGGGLLRMIGTAGLMEVSASAADVIDIKGDEGSIRVTNTTIRDALRVSTRTGSVLLTQLDVAARGSIQVESDSGDITLYVRTFRGTMSVVTSGNIQCVTAAVDGFDDVEPCLLTAGGGTDENGKQRLKIVEGISVNCKTNTRNDCPYLGHVTITSTSGNVVIRADKVTAS